MVRLLGLTVSPEIVTTPVSVVFTTWHIVRTAR